MELDVVALVFLSQIYGPGNLKMEDETNAKTFTMLLNVT